MARWTSVPHLAQADTDEVVLGCGSYDLLRSALTRVLLLPQGVVKISGTLIERAGARFDTHIGAGQTRVLPIDVVDAQRATRPKQCSKAAS
jgi:glutamate racemase